MIIGSAVVEGILTGYGTPMHVRGGRSFPYLVDIQYKGKIIPKQAMQYKLKFFSSKPPKKSCSGKKIKVYYKQNKKRVVLKSFRYSKPPILAIVCMLAFATWGILQALGMAT